jgi:hypothetical protein
VRSPSAAILQGRKSKVGCGDIVLRVAFAANVSKKLALAVSRLYTKVTQAQVSTFERTKGWSIASREAIL